MGLNQEKTGGRKSRDTLPLTHLVYFSLQIRSFLLFFNQKCKSKSISGTDFLLGRYTGKH